jgi:AMP phosphorylase
MELKIKLLKWTAGLPVAMLKKETADEIGLHANDRISIKTKSGKQFSMILDIMEDGLIKNKEIGVTLEVKEILNLKLNQMVSVSLASAPKSLNFIKKKLNNHALSQEEIREIIIDVVDNSISEPEIALFISAMYRNGMSMKETIYLISSILESGDKLNLKKDLMVDKHSIGGIAGNRTTPLVVSICAAGGLICPKTSSRAITSAAGTADVIDAIAKVDFSMKELRKIIIKTNGCMVWGGSLGMVPADSKIIHIEKLLKIDPESQLLASIMSKKLAMGSKYILIDIPYGKSAKVSLDRAKHLKRKFEQLGKHFKKKLKVVLTDGSQPIGNGIGPILELIDIIKILDPKQRGPLDLEKKSIFLAGELFEMTGKAQKGKGIEMAEKILRSGKAFEKFKEIIKAQKGKVQHFKPSKIKKDIFSNKSGEIKEIDNKIMNSLARAAGSPLDKFAGLYLYNHVGDKIKKGEKLITLYTQSKSRLKEALNFYNRNKPITIG